MRRTTTSQRIDGASGQRRHAPVANDDQRGATATGGALSNTALRGLAERAGDTGGPGATRSPLSVNSLGNRAIARIVQRAPAPRRRLTSSQARRRRRASELGAPTAEELLTAQMPWVAGLLSPAQLQQIQNVVDAWVLNPVVKGEVAKLDAAAIKSYGSISVTDPAKQSKADAAREDLVPFVPGDRYFRLRLEDVTTGDLLTPPSGLDPGEMRFRDSLFQRLTTQGIWLSVGSMPTATVSLTYGRDGYAFDAKQKLTLEKIKECQPLGALWWETVMWSPERKAMGHEISRLFVELQSSQGEHMEDQSFHNTLVTGPWSELIGGADFPPLSIWTKPWDLYWKARDRANADDVLSALGLLGRVASMVQRNAILLNEYENKTLEGATLAVKWLRRAKFAGEIAAVLATAGGGIAGLSAGAAGMGEAAAIYGGTQELVGQIASGSSAPDIVKAVGGRMVTDYVVGRASAFVGMRAGGWAGEVLGADAGGIAGRVGKVGAGFVGGAAASTVTTTAEIVGGVAHGNAMPGAGSMLLLYLERATEAGLTGAAFSAIGGGTGSKRDVERGRVQKLLQEKGVSQFDRVNKLAVERLNAGKSLEGPDFAAMRSEIRVHADRLRRGALPDGTRTTMEGPEREALAKALEEAFENHVHGATSYAKSTPDGGGTTSRGYSDPSAVPGWRG